MRVVFSLVITSLLCFGAFRKRSLSGSGTFAAAFVGLSTTSNDNMLFTAVLLVFFVTSSFWTKYQAKAKARIDPAYTKASRRDWKQVLCNGGIGSLISLIYQYNFDGCQIDELTIEKRKLMVLLVWCYVGFYACCAADTWASELGTLSSDWPLLITTLKPVLPGTNGAVSKLGLLSSFAGGAAVGLSADICLWIQYFSAYRSGTLPKIPYNMLGALLGLLGSLIDSVLGATVQASYLINNHAVSDISAQELSQLDGKLLCGRNILTNNMVNVVASASTVALAACFYALVF